VVSKSIAKKTVNNKLKLQLAVAETSKHMEITNWRQEISNYWLPKYMDNVLK
jgi:hypothetical protein